MPKQAAVKSQQLRALGFCGADDSVHPHHLALISHSFPVVEFGILFRPDCEGQPRYATTAWVDQLCAVAALSNAPAVATLDDPMLSSSSLSRPRSRKMRLAAHLCGTRVNEFLLGYADFIQQVAIHWGFQRIQINATAVNGVQMDLLTKPDMLENVRSILVKYQDTEFIIQKNDETDLLWRGLLQHEAGVPTNVSMLEDESKGNGVVLSSGWPSPPPDHAYEIGYAGGIGPDNVDAILDQLCQVAQGRTFWIDMESRLRSIKNGKDVFDLDKCFAVIETVCSKGLMDRPGYMLSN